MPLLLALIFLVCFPVPIQDEADPESFFKKKKACLNDHFVAFNKKPVPLDNIRRIHVHLFYHGRKRADGV